jgi:hypothetical protein
VPQLGQLVDALSHEAVILTQRDAKTAYSAPVLGAASSPGEVHYLRQNLIDALSRVTDL